MSRKIVALSAVCLCMGGIGIALGGCSLLPHKAAKPASALPVTDANAAQCARLSQQIADARGQLFVVETYRKQLASIEAKIADKGSTPELEQSRASLRKMVDAGSGYESDKAAAEAARKAINCP